MALSKQQRRLAALAAAIHTDLAQSRPALPRIDLPNLQWDRCRHQLSQWQRSHRRGYRTAALIVLEDLRHTLAGLEVSIQQVRAQLPVQPRRRLSTSCDIYGDLLGLYDEFPAVEWNKRQGRLEVTTEPINLDGRYLGPFKIKLYWRDIGQHTAYSVEALDPQPSARDSEVTHPHVQGETLCEGEGTTAIRAALRDGRLLDFFLIINNLLHTYNSGSPYVGLDEWDGVRCSECDYSMDEDDSRCCERCETRLCCECYRCCGECSDTLCTNCSRICPGCDEDVCRGCVKECRDCDQSFCSSCLQDDERCQTCHEEFQEQADGQPSDATLQSV